VSPSRDAPAAGTRTRALLGSADPLFAALCTRALADGSIDLEAAVAPRELLEATRRTAPDLLLLDVDGDDPAAWKALATKLMLVSEARLVLLSAYLAPGSPGLSSLLQSIPATFVHKPEGPSSLSLADGDGPAFAAALAAAYAGHDLDELGGVVPEPLPAGFDAGWDTDGEAP
jgi:hypothetical protein